MEFFQSLDDNVSLPDESLGEEELHYNISTLIPLTGFFSNTVVWRLKLMGFLVFRAIRRTKLKETKTLSLNNRVKCSNFIMTAII